MFLKLKGDFRPYVHSFFLLLERKQLQKTPVSQVQHIEKLHLFKIIFQLFKYKVTNDYVTNAVSKNYI